MAKTFGSLLRNFSSTATNPLFGLDLFRQEAQIGLIADGHDHRIRRQDLAVGELHGRLRDRLREAGPEELRPGGLRVFPFHAEGGGRLDVDQRDGFGAEPGRLRGGVAADVSRPDDDDVLPDLRLIELAFPEKIEGGDRPFVARERGSSAASAHPWR